MATTVFAVRMTMFPTCSNRPFAGRKARSAAVRITGLVPRRPRRRPDAPPAHDRSERSEPRDHLPLAFALLARLGVGDDLPWMRAGVGGHRGAAQAGRLLGLTPA